MVPILEIGPSITGTLRTLVCANRRTKPSPLYRPEDRTKYIVDRTAIIRVGR